MKTAISILLAAATSLAFVAAQPAVAQNDAKGGANEEASAKRTESKAKKSKKRAAATNRRQAEEALEFARIHHPEVARLVTQLRKTKPDQFKSAIRHLIDSKERLERIQIRSPERYDTALEAWKLDSRIRLLAARMTMSGNPELEAELTTALLQRTELRLRQLSDERERLTARLKRIDESISRIESDPEAAAAWDLKRVKKQLHAKSRRKPATQIQSRVPPKESGAPSKEN